MHSNFDFQVFFISLVNNYSLTLRGFLRKMKVPIVREDYLVDCMERKKKLPFGLYRVEATSETSSVVTVKVKGRSAVHEASGLQDSGHILEEGKSIFNTTLNMSDLSTGVNRWLITFSSFYFCYASYCKSQFLSNQMSIL